MRFEVEVDDRNRLDTLHEARKRYNAKNAKQAGFVPADDMPSFVQRMMDDAVVKAIDSTKVKRQRATSA